MKQGPRYRVKPRRRREGKTDYRKRLRLLKSGKPRVVVRNSLKHVRVQFVGYDEKGDKILASAISTELTNKYNWKLSTSTTPAAYMTGLLAGKRALDIGIKEGVLDIGRSTPSKGSKNFAVLKGVLDSGIEVPHNKETLPSDDRILGKNLNKEITNFVNDFKSTIVGGK
jgi:large subunit ribosomal protein L18